jgi:hypothetical protein
MKELNESSFWYIYPQTSESNLKALAEPEASVVGSVMLKFNSMTSPAASLGVTAYR